MPMALAELDFPELLGVLQKPFAVYRLQQLFEQGDHLISTFRMLRGRQGYPALESACPRLSLLKAGRTVNQSGAERRWGLASSDLCHSRNSGNPLSSQFMDSRFRGNDN
jgi:hypothetical protein